MTDLCVVFPTGTEMSVARSTCLRCCMAVSERQTVDPGREFCGRCMGPMSVRCILVTNTGLTALRAAMFNRLRSPRPQKGAMNSVANVTFEQLEAWMTGTWRHVRIRETAKQVVRVFCLVDWRDVAQLCQFEEVAVGTRYPTQGRGNVRLAAGNTMGVICPPVIVTHRYTITPCTCSPLHHHLHANFVHLAWCRTKHFVARGAGGQDVSSSPQVERVQVRYSIGIVHEYSNSVQLSLDYPEHVPEDSCMETWPALPPYHHPGKHITEQFRRDMVALPVTAFRGETGQPVMETIAMWNASAL